MATKISSDVLEGYLRCKFKGHLKLAGRQGTKCEFEAMLTGLRAEVRLKAIEAIIARHPGDQVARDVPLTTAVLRRGPQYILDGTFEDDSVALHLDGLKRAQGASKLGDFHYLPVLFHEGRQVKKEQKLLLEVYGVILSGIQGRVPAHGIIWHGPECKPARVELNPDHRRAERVLRDLREMAGTASSPRLLLNEHCQVCEFRERCHAQAVQEDNISLLRGMREQEVKRLARKGIFTLTQLSYTFRLRKKNKKAKKQGGPNYSALKALAIRDKITYVLGAPEVPDSPVKIYMDMEGIPDEGYVYLIGLIVVANGSERRFSFWADGKDQEAEIFEQFMAEVTRHENFVVFCYGSYERTFLKRMRETANRKKPVDRVLAALVNALSVVYSHIYFPTYSNSLKIVGGYLGCTWNDPRASGIQSIAWRKQWEASRDNQLKQKLTEYNQEDCAALRRVSDFISGIAHAGLPAIRSGDAQSTRGIASAEGINPAPKEHEWFRRNRLIPDFDAVNRCAFFDHQRENVYVRTNDELKQLSVRKGKRRAKQYFSKRSTSRQVKVVCRKCPRCKSAAVRESKRGPMRSRCEIDLRFSKRGIRRHVTKYSSRQYRCRSCGSRFLPVRLTSRTRVRKYTHAFQSWVVYLHVVHRLSFDGIRELAWEFFGIQIYHGELYSFQSILAKYCQDTYRQILARIVGGAFLHADETSAKLRGDAGYVWVLATMLDVAYLYNPSREGDFIQKVLVGFRGVLVSDFFAAYDGVSCVKQRCLAHLIRDCNDDLLANPWDEELRRLIDQFARLLRTVIATVDQRGLRTRYLARHRTEVDGFFAALAPRRFCSEVAQKYQKRFLKYRSELFAFLDYDGVPWNNNNAENAIKQFAQYRVIAEGRMTERGLSDYLVLLSIEETCRYRGISFLRFLLSGETDLYQYHEQIRKKRHSTST
jgi:predicted RecB family nuclease